MNSIIITTATNSDNTATRQSIATEVVADHSVYLEDSRKASTSTFAEREDVPASLQDEMAKCIEETNRATARLQRLILRTAPEQQMATPGISTASPINEDSTQLTDY